MVGGALLFFHQKTALFSSSPVSPCTVHFCFVLVLFWLQRIPLQHSTTLSLLHSTNPPLCHSITLPFHHSTNPPLHHSTNPTLYLSITSPLSCSTTPPLYHATIVQLHHFVFSASQVIPLSRTFLWTILMCLFYLSCLSFSFVTNKSSPSPQSHKDAIYN